jgi:hypothetical protein
VRGSTFTLNLYGVNAWRSERRPRELERRLAKMDPAYQAAEVPALVEQRRGEAELAELNAPLQEAWQRSREAERRRARRRSVAGALGAAIARATACRGRHRRAPGSSPARRRGSRRATGGSSSSSGDDGSGEPEPAGRGLLRSSHVVPVGLGWAA